ncbi:hypothetical protein [Candidatus Nitrosocosmicus sp. R]
MNLIESEIQILVEAKICGCNTKPKSISYNFIESSHSLCLDNREIVPGTNPGMWNTIKGY